MTVSKIPHHFVDGTLRITFSGGVFRIVLGMLGTAEDDNQQTPPPLEEEVQLNIPVDGFKQLVDSCNNIWQQLEQQGVVAPTEGTEAPAAGPAPAGAPRKKPTSSNFN